MKEETFIVYKKVNIYKDGTLHPLFIDKKREFKIGEWMHSEYHPTKGFKPRSIKDNIGGWHCCFQPIAPHLSDELKNGQKRVWLKCLAKGLSQVYDRPESQGGSWILVEYIKPMEIIDND